jgi:hypothetical protein
MRRRRRMTHNYIKKFQKLVDEGKLDSTPGEMSAVRVEHDDWCLFFKGGECNCDPTFVETKNVKGCMATEVWTARRHE